MKRKSLLITFLLFIFLLFAPYFFFGYQVLMFIPNNEDNLCDIPECDNFSTFFGDQAAVGTTYYVSESEGDDANNGTSESFPLKTFTRLNVNISRTNIEPIITEGQPVLFDNGTPCYRWVESVQSGNITLKPGDKILLKRGDVWNQSLHLMGKGVESGYIELGAYGMGALPQIRLNSQEYEKCVILEGASYWKISDLDLRGAKLGLYLHYWDDYENSHVMIENCYFQDHASPLWERTWEHNYEYSWSCGIFLGGCVLTEPHKPVLSNLLVRNCEFNNCTVAFGNNWYWPELFRSRLQNLYLVDCVAYGGMQAMMLNNVDGGYTRRFYLLDGGGNYSCGAAGGFIQYSQNYHIDRCLFANVKRVYCPDGVGFDFEGDCHNICFTNNVLYNNDGAGILVMSSQGTNTNIKIQHCLFYNNCRNPTGDKYAFELLCYDSETTGVLHNISIYKGDDFNYVSQKPGLTIEKSGEEPKEYSVDYLGQEKSLWISKWEKFHYTYNVKRLEYDPSMDYTMLWNDYLGDGENGCAWEPPLLSVEDGLFYISIAFVAIVIVVVVKKSRDKKT